MGKSDFNSRTGRPNFRAKLRSEARYGESSRRFPAKQAQLYPENWEELSQAVKRRDNYCCQIHRLLPGTRCRVQLLPPFSKYLHTHHVIPLPKGSNKPRNLITLCLEHHSLVHQRHLGSTPAKVRAFAFKR